MVTVEIVEADLGIPEHQQAVLNQIDAFAMDEMGDGRPLSPEGRPVGIAVCFRGFSTFAARPLINISDLHVLPVVRGQGIGRRLLEAVEDKARETGCCKLTLDVQEQNHRARHLYGAAGFARDVHVEAAGGALFLSKRL